MAKTIDMSKHLSVFEVIAYVSPAIVMLLFTSVYDIVDGLFVSNFAGVTAFAALNIVMPYLLILGTVGFMVGAGANAVIAQARGEGNEERANGLFSFFVYATLIFGSIVFCLAELFLEPVCVLFGATDPELLEQCLVFGRVSLISLPAFMLQYAFQSLFATAGKPGVGMVIIATSGLINVLCDCFFVWYLGLGVMGAGISTTIAEIFGGMVPCIYFWRPNSSFLRLGKPTIDFRVLAGVCANGSSEMMTSIATSVVSIFYNYQLLVYLGENGVAAYGVIMYVSMIFCAVYMGYSVGVAPLMSYQHGANNGHEKRSLMRKSFALLIGAGLICCLIAETLSNPLSYIFTGYDANLLDLTEHAFHIYAVSFIFMSLNIYASSLFTALGNGTVSAAISFARTLLFEVGFVMVLPLFFGEEGIWWAIVVAEIGSLGLNAFLFFRFAPQYDLRVISKEMRDFWATMTGKKKQELNA